MKMKTQRVTITAAALLMSMTVAQAASYRLACPSAETSTTCLAATYFSDKVRELSKGDIDIQVFPAGQLGSGAKAIQQMRAGVLDFVVESMSNYGNFVDDFNVVSWGFTFRDNAHFQTFLASDLQKAMQDELNETSGVKMLAGNWSKLPRMVVSTRPINTPEDLAGLKFRVPGIPSFIKTWSTLGANPTQVPWGESFQALKTGLTDAMETPYDSILSQKFHLAAPYVSLTEHVYDSITVSMNGARFAKLDAADQELLLQAAADAADYSAELVSEVAKTVASKLEADGATILEVDRAPFAAKLKAAAHEQETDGLWGAGLYDSIQALQ